MKPHKFGQEAWIAFVVNRPRLTILLSLGLTGLIILGIGGVGLSASPREYMGLENPRTQELVRLETEYARNNSVMLAFSVEKGSVFDAASLDAIRHVTENAWQLPYVQRVDSITNFQYSYADADNIIVEDLVPQPASELSEAQLSKIKERALQEPRLRNLLLSADGRSTAVNITFTVALHDNVALKEIEAAVDQLVAETMALQPRFENHQTGYIELCLGWLNAMFFDVTYMFTTAFVLMCVALFLFFRSVVLTAVTMLLALLSVLASLGAAGYFDAMLHPPSMIGTLVILMLALADAVHIVNRSRALLAEGYDKAAAIAESLRFNIKPVLITSVTTSIGFLSFLANDFSGIRLMGAYIAFGVMYACLLSVSFLPAAMRLLHIKPSKVRQRKLKAAAYTQWIVRYRWAFVALTVPMIIVSGFIITHTRLDDSPIHYIAKSQPFRQHQMAIEDRLTGTIEILLELDSGQSQGVAAPAFMATVDRFTSWLQDQPGVRAVSTYTDTMKHLNRVMHGDDPAYYRLPDNQQLASQYLLLYELSLPYGLDLTNQINIDKSATRLSFFIDDTTATHMMRLSRNIDDWLDSNAPNVRHDQASGDTIEFAISNFASLESMFVGALTALAIIAGILLLTFRSLMPGTLCTIMVISPLALCFGVWSLAVGYFDVGAILTMCMLIGIVVDNAVHFVSKYQLAVKEHGHQPRQAVEYVIARVGGAIITNTLVLASSFGILAFSAFTANSEMGELTVISLLLGLVATFTLLPSLLVIWGEWKLARQRSA